MSAGDGQVVDVGHSDNPGDELEAPLLNEGAHVDVDPTVGHGGDDFGDEREAAHVDPGVQAVDEELQPDELDPGEPGSGNEGI